MTTDVFGTSTAIPSGTATTHRTGRRVLSLGIGATAALAMFIGGMGATASAAPGDSAVVSVDVSSTISMTGLTDAVLTPVIPGTLAEGSIGYNVQSNTPYVVNVTAAQSNLWVGGLVPTTPGPNNQIPIATLQVEDNLGAPTSLSTTVPVLLRSGARSLLAGDDLTNNYSLLVPFVDAGNYSVQVNYIATTSV